MPSRSSLSVLENNSAPSRQTPDIERRRRRRTIATPSTILMRSWAVAATMLSLLMARARGSLHRPSQLKLRCGMIRACAFVSGNADTSIRRNLQKNDHMMCTSPSSSTIPSRTALRMNFSKSNSPTDERDPDAFALSGYQRPKVNWYPGHIAKAERQLSETLKSVDVVIEVRDARAPKATAHPSVGKWTAGRPRVVVLTRMDTVTVKNRETWREAYKRLGADRWEEALAGEEKNRNVQLRMERNKYSGEEGGGGSGGVEEVLFVDAKRGQGTHAISRAVYRAGRHVNERRKRRGLNDRSLRVGIIGFPNIGKSALINRLLGRRRARTANTPGVTRSLQWIRVAADKYSTSASGSSSSNRGENSRKKGFELLDSPGIIPSDMLDQSDALLLAACNSVGVGAYDNQAVAAYLCDRIQSLVMSEKENIAAPQWRQKCIERYRFDPLVPLSEQNIAARWGSENTDGSANSWIAWAAKNRDRIPTGEDMLFIVADNTCQGDPENAARKILQDFRMGRMGPVALQLAPESEVDDGQAHVEAVQQEGINLREVDSPSDHKRAAEDAERRQKEEIEQRAKAAQEAAKEKGLELPPVMEGNVDGQGGDDDDEEEADVQKPAESEVGKGLFDGW